MSRKKTNPALLGLFVVGGLLLIFATVFSLAGGKLLVRKQAVVMHFGGSIYGLQVGAPVVFRGVRLGSISSIGLSYDKATSRVVIPVTAELDREMLRNVSGGNKSDDPGLALPGMIERGLRAQLAMQSILTGQLYVDLDFRSPKFRLFLLPSKTCKTKSKSWTSSAWWPTYPPSPVQPAACWVARS